MKPWQRACIALRKYPGPIYREADLDLVFKIDLDHHEDEKNGNDAFQCRPQVRELKLVFSGVKTLKISDLPSIGVINHENVGLSAAIRTVFDSIEPWQTYLLRQRNYGDSKFSFLAPLYENYNGTFFCANLDF